MHASSRYVHVRVCAVDVAGATGVYVIITLADVYQCCRFPTCVC